MITRTLAGPLSCPGCRYPWSPGGECPRCGLLYSEAEGWLRAGCEAYEEARRAASEGRFTDAQRHLIAVHVSGIVELTEDPAVMRLEELCRVALGEVHAVSRTAANDEVAARNAAARGDFRSAVYYAGRAARSLPGNLPLRKLYFLVLRGAGRTAEARSEYATLLKFAPADPDLLRWRFPETDDERRISVRTVGVVALAVGCVLGLLWGSARNRARGGN